jgi:hypothetical protein
MTKQRLTLISFVLIAFASYYWWPKSSNPQTSKTSVTQATKPLHEVFAQFEGRTIVDKKRQPLNRLPAGVSYINRPSPDWQKKLKSHLLRQAGNSLKDIKILQERSLVWVRDENALQVESVLISLKDQRDMESSFRALIDSQTGKVLETWDRTIFDSMDKSAEFRLKLDPRYSN